MSLSEVSIKRMASSLSEDFNVFVAEFYNEQLSETFADAANLFIQAELGDIDGDLSAQLALQLIQTQYIAFDPEGGNLSF